MERVAVTPGLFERAGYKPFADMMKEGQFYEGSWQKRFDDERGKRYFINVSLWQFPDQPMTAQAEVQFYDADDMEGGYCNVARPFETGIDAMEAFFAKLWLLMNFGHYEVTAASPSPRLPLVRRVG